MRKNLEIILVFFIAIVFNSESACQSWLTAFEARWQHAPAWHYAYPAQLRDGRWYVPIVSSAEQYLTEAERATCVELSESDLPDPLPLPPEVPK